MRSLSQLAAVVTPAGNILIKSARLIAVAPSEAQSPEKSIRGIAAILPTHEPELDEPVTIIAFSVRFSCAKKALALTVAASQAASVQKVRTILSTLAIK
jgi:hypothetical protein